MPKIALGRMSSRSTSLSDCTAARDKPSAGYPSRSCPMDIGRLPVDPGLENTISWQCWGFKGGAVSHGEEIEQHDIGVRPRSDDASVGHSENRRCQTGHLVHRGLHGE